ncbi:zinc-ribbon domain-containing protein [Roseovarius aestuarii]|nr:zinc-ribbon domain-containing protein [Roseovarius aestuarii]
MRLTCPNCGAQYEVPDDVIPESGRDVQCSNCGDTWFQAHPDHPLPGAEEHDADTNLDDADTWEDVPPTDEHQSDSPDEQPEDASDSTTDIEPEPQSDPTPSAPIRARRGLDPDVAEVLREEAEREQRARAAQNEGAGGLETQPDLGLEDINDGERRAREARARMARLRGEDADALSHHPDADDDPLDGIDPSSRRSLFPDIEEINSSLGSNSDMQADADEYDPYPEPIAPARGGFRRGFLLVVLIAVIAMLVYMFAPALARKLPALQGVLTDYVVWVDGLRVWLDGQIAALMAWLDTMASGTNTPTAPDTAPAASQNGS